MNFACFLTVVMMRYCPNLKLETIITHNQFNSKLEQVEVTINKMANFFIHLNRARNVIGHEYWRKIIISLCPMGF